MHRIWAIIERDLRRFRRSPVLVIVSILMPLVQLVVLGYAFGGKIKNLQIGIVDQDHGVPAVKLKEMCQAISVNAATFTPIAYVNETTALSDLRNGRINGVLSIPPHFSRDVLEGANPHIALVEDNTDQFSASALEGSFDSMLVTYNGPAVPARTTTDVDLSVVEVYPYVPYIQFLLPGTISLSIFVSAMIGGGIIFIDDKARGLHEGYLVTPISKFELIMGFTLAGAAKAIIAGIPDPLDPIRIAKMFVLVVATSMALISMMFMIMVRVSDPLVPRAIFGMLNTVLYFPSGAVYPTASFPGWMKAIAVVDPFTYAVDGFKELVLKNTSLAAINYDLAFLAGFTVLTLGLATLLFRRTL